MNILSLCDGMSCLQIACDELKLKIDTYYASEIYDKAIQITQKNYPNTIQIGDITKIDEEILKKLPRIDLIGFGFPCKGCSITNLKNYKQGLKQKQSILFFDCLRILEWIQQYNNPNVYFLCENVESMKNSEKEIITECLKVDCIEIDAGLVSAADRKRYYWTNIPNVTQPEDRGLVLNDIILPVEKIPDKYWCKETFDFHGDDKKVIATLHINGHDLIKRVYNSKFKCATLTGVTGGNQQKKVFQNGKCRKLIPLEYERMQCVKEGYTEGVADSHRWNMLGNGWNIRVIKHILKELKKVFN